MLEPRLPACLPLQVYDELSRSRDAVRELRAQASADKEFTTLRLHHSIPVPANTANATNVPTHVMQMFLHGRALSWSAMTHTGEAAGGRAGCARQAAHSHTTHAGRVRYQWFRWWRRWWWWCGREAPQWQQPATQPQVRWGWRCWRDHVSHVAIWGAGTWDLQHVLAGGVQCMEQLPTGTPPTHLLAMSDVTMVLCLV